MHTYDVRLQSQTDDQWRLVTVDAETPKIAQALAERQERRLCEFSLLPPKPAEPKEPTGTSANDVEVMAQFLEARDTYAAELDSFPARQTEGQRALEKLEKQHKIGDDGRVTGPSGRGRAHLHAHYQQQPYKVVSVEESVPNVDQIITALKALHGNKALWTKALKRMRDEGLPLGVVTGSIFGLWAQKQLDASASVVWSSATIKVALTTSTWSPNQDTHDFFDDVTNEVAASGTYVAGGLTLGSKTSTYDTATDTIRLDAADFSATGTTITARRAVVYNDTAGAASTDPVMGWVDFGADFSTTAGTFAITWDATGIFVFDVT